MIDQKQVEDVIEAHANLMAEYNCRIVAIYDCLEAYNDIQYSMAKLKRILDAFMLQEELKS